MFHGTAVRVRGLSHRRKSTPCQDAAEIAVSRLSGSDLVVGVLADGGGSRSLSHIGARVTVTLASLLSRNIWSAASFDAERPDGLRSYWVSLFQDCRASLQLEADMRGTPSGGRLGVTAATVNAADIAPYACTLLAFIASRRRVSAAQVGDGFIVLGHRSATGVDYRLAFQNAHHAEAGQVVWLTADEWQRDFRAETFEGRFDLIMASSDGLEPAVLTSEPVPGAPMVPHQPFFQKFHDGATQTAREAIVTAGAADPPLQAYALRTLSQPALDGLTDDDKAIALAVWVGADDGASP